MHHFEWFKWFFAPYFMYIKLNIFSNFSKQKNYFAYMKEDQGMEIYENSLNLTILS